MALTTEQIQSIYSARPDIQQYYAQGDPKHKGTTSEWGVNHWWDKIGSKESPGLINGPSTPSTPSTSVPTMYGTNYPAFQNTFDANQYLPSIQQQATSIYQPQLQALEALRGLGKSTYETSKVSTEADFKKRMQQEVESINSRGAFFSGGAIQNEQDLRSEHARNLQQLTLQYQSSDFQNLAQQAGLSAEQAQYIQDKLFNSENSAYNRAWNQYQFEYGAYSDQQSLEEQRRQFEANLAFDKLKYSKDLGLKKEAAQASLAQAEASAKAAAEKSKVSDQHWLAEYELKQERLGLDKEKEKSANLQRVTKKDILGQTISGTFNPSTGEYRWDE